VLNFDTFSERKEVYT